VFKFGGLFAPPLHPSLPQPRILLCHVREAKGLPVMDRATMLTDAYVCTTFGKLSHRTEVQRKTLNPVWDEKFRFEITDDELLVEGECFVAVLCACVTACLGTLGRCGWGGHCGRSAAARLRGPRRFRWTPPPPVSASLRLP
jgi:hypothetical protein